MIYRHTIAAAVLSAAFFAVPQAHADDNQGHNGKGNEKGNRVLLISIDGMHALDFQNCVTTGDCPNLASLAQHGVTYTRTSTSKPSDSFPGLMNIVSGGSPKTHGAFYDVAFDRALAPPTVDTGNGLLKGTCTSGVYPGTTTEFEEGVEIDQTQLNGGLPGAALTDGTYLSIDPKKLPRDPGNGCLPVYPWNFVRVNTIFGVMHKHGMPVAWSDKHGVYAAVSGPTGTTTPSNLDDYYSPEVNSNIVGLPGVSTPATKNNPAGVSCATVRDNNGGDWTTSFQNIQCYDTLKVNGVLNWINGKMHTGSGSLSPKLFGMNFQAVSVGQKLIEKGVKGGYLDGAGTFTPALADEIQFVDAGIGEMVSALNHAGLLNSTTIIITAKHGQSPINTNLVVMQGSPTPAGVLSSLLAPSQNDPLGPTEDDISLLWLKNPNPSSSDLQAALSMLQTTGNPENIDQIFYGPSLTTMFNAPGFPAGDSRTPDIIVQPHFGTTYSGSSKKQAEHGGFSFDDTNVMLLVSNPSIQPRTLTTFVETMQVAPTVLSIMGLNPNELDGVKKEGTPVLPGLDFGN